MLLQLCGDGLGDFIGGRLHALHDRHFLYGQVSAEWRLEGWKYITLNPVDEQVIGYLLTTPYLALDCY